MTRPTCATRLALVTCLLLLGLLSGLAQSIKSLPLDPQAYKQIIATRDRVPDPQRLEQLIAQYRGEFEIERVDTAQLDGQRIAWVSYASDKLALWQTIFDLRLEAVRSFDPSKLDAAARLDWRVLRERFEADAESRRAGFIYTSPTYHLVEPPDGNFADTPRTRADYADRLAWLRGIPVALKHYEEALRTGLARGLTDSRADVSAAITSMRAAAPANPLDSPYLKPFKTFPASIAPAEQKQLLDEAVSVYRNGIATAYSQYLRFLEQTYLPGARSSESLAELPTGHALYTLSMRGVTGLRVDPAEIHEAALTEAKQLHDELNRLARESGFVGSGSEYLIAIRKDPKCAPLDAAAAKTAFDAQMQRLEPALPRLFAVVPAIRTEFEVAPDLPFAFGDAVPVDGSAKDGRPGRVRGKVPYTNACAFLSVMRHDGVPGHLFQHHIAAQSQFVAGRVPAGSPAYQEGWAEYASDLAPELGLQLDAYAQAERIGGRIFMAARTAVDTGVNWHGWTSEKAAAYYRDAAPWAPSGVVEAVVKTAFDAPARQAMYFVGARQMHELREYATKELGAKFDVRRFHDEILKYGPLPLGVLEEQIHEWVAQEKLVR